MHIKAKKYAAHLSNEPMKTKFCNSQSVLWKTVVTWNFCDPSLVSVHEIAEHLALKDSSQNIVLGLLEEAGTG